MSIVEASGCERAATDVREVGGSIGTAVGPVGGAALEEMSVGDPLAEESSSMKAGV
jgi:hypothetical protein